MEVFARKTIQAIKRGFLEQLWNNLEARLNVVPFPVVPFPIVLFAVLPFPVVLLVRIDAAPAGSSFLTGLSVRFGIPGCA
jgi:hypothetical protein